MHPDAALDVAGPAMIGSDRPAPVDGFDDGCNAATPLWASARTKARCAPPTISPVNPPVQRSAQTASFTDDGEDVVPERIIIVGDGWPEMPLGVTDGLQPEALGKSRRLYRRRSHKRRRRRRFRRVPETDESEAPPWMVGAMVGLWTGFLLVHPLAAWAMWACVTAVTGVWMLAADRHFWWPVCAALSLNYWGAAAWIGRMVSFEVGAALAVLAVGVRWSGLHFPVNGEEDEAKGGAVASAPPGQTDNPDYVPFIKSQHALNETLKGIRPFIHHVIAMLHSHLRTEVGKRLGRDPTCNCDNHNFADIAIDPISKKTCKRKPSFRVGAVYHTASVNLNVCQSKSCTRDPAVLCSHRFATCIPRPVDPSYARYDAQDCVCEAWAAAITLFFEGKERKGGQLNFGHSDATLWAESPWEIAKLFMPTPIATFDFDNDRPSPKALAMVTPNDFDATCLFGLVMHCLAFQGEPLLACSPVRVDRPRWLAAIKIRNDCVGHVARHEISADLYMRAMDTLEALLADPALHIKDAPFVDAVERAQLRLGLLRAATADEVSDMRIREITEARTDLHHATITRLNSIKFLTNQQYAKFAEWRAGKIASRGAPGKARKSFRKLIQAPSGSGKTLIAVMLAADFLRARRAANDGDETSDSDADESADDARQAQPVQSFLLLGHNDTLVDHALVPELETILTTFDVLLVHQQATGAWISNTGLAEVVVCSVNTLMRNAGAWSRRFMDVVVDEGHLVFSSQPDGHTGEDVVRALESTMCGEDGRSCDLLIMHDTSYQHVGEAPAFDAFTQRVKGATAELDIVRNPGPVRDASVPFSSELRIGAQRQAGTEEIFRLFNERQGISHQGERSVRFADVPSPDDYNHPVGAQPCSGVDVHTKRFAGRQREGGFHHHVCWSRRDSLRVDEFENQGVWLTVGIA